MLDFTLYKVTLGQGKAARTYLITATDLNNAAFLVTNAERAPLSAVSKIVRIKAKPKRDRCAELIARRLDELSN
jgi:hypothetical protein